jgi:hypothetical protein
MRVVPHRRECVVDLDRAGLSRAQGARMAHALVPAEEPSPSLTPGAGDSFRVERDKPATSRKQSQAIDSRR